jgi:hypothetical protein
VNVEFTTTVPSSVAVPDKCEMDRCLNPNKPTALISPATKASTNAAYSSHWGNLKSRDSLGYQHQLIVESLNEKA